ncbi:MAG: hypothetical protein QOE82_101 [Thermoanaerobaculia bacterium]|nr:hypothetical protein [Thermoanaerobaculia bacterium]
MKRAILFVACALFTQVLQAQEMCPCVPITQMWVVEAADTWNKAASAMVMANGDPYVVTLPAATGDGRWIVLKRVNAGAYVAPPDAPFLMETFDGVSAASARFTATSSDHAPMMLTLPDGKVVLVTSREAVAKKRAVKP